MIKQYLRQFEFKPKNQISQLYESIGYSSKKTKKLPFFHLGEGIVKPIYYLDTKIKRRGSLLYAQIKGKCQINCLNI
jgi:hypothetical protein